MDFLIILKWFSSPDQSPPSIISTLINSLLRPLSLPDSPVMQDPERQLRTGLALLTVAATCVPIMLFPKPLLLARKKHRVACEPSKNALLSDSSVSEESLVI